jgi:hypothetical protein
MLDQYGSVLCICVCSSMRLATIEPTEAGTSMAMFECRYPPCGRSHIVVLGKTAEQLSDAVVEAEATGSIKTVRVEVDVRPV